jgi:hypothetical protein
MTTYRSRWARALEHALMHPLRHRLQIEEWIVSGSVE